MRDSGPTGSAGVPHRVVEFPFFLSIPSHPPAPASTHTGAMFRTLLLLFMAAMPFLLAYVFGFWVLVAVALLAGATFVFSTGRAREEEETQGGMLTGYSTLGADL
jgi:hypothetical protein